MLEGEKTDTDRGYVVERDETAGFSWRDGVSRVIADRVTFEIVSSGIILQSTLQCKYVFIGLSARAPHLFNLIFVNSAVPQPFASLPEHMRFLIVPISPDCALMQQSSEWSVSTRSVPSIRSKSDVKRGRVPLAVKQV